MRIIKRGVLALLIVVAAFFFVVNYSEYTTIYECSGVITKAPDKSDPITLFVKIAQDRSWVFWGNLNGVLRLEFTTGSIPTISDVIDPINADRLFKTGPNSLSPGRPFPGLFWANEREDLFVIKRVDTFLNLYSWPKKGEVVDLTKSGQGQFSTVSNSLTLNIGEATFRGTCTSKNN
jgi:hypothetical protein